MLDNFTKLNLLIIFCIILGLIFGAKYIFTDINSQIASFSKDYTSFPSELLKDNKTLKFTVRIKGDSSNVEIESEKFQLEKGFVLIGLVDGFVSKKIGKAFVPADPHKYLNFILEDENKSFQLNKLTWLPCEGGKLKISMNQKFKKDEIFSVSDKKDGVDTITFAIFNSHKPFAKGSRAKLEELKPVKEESLLAKLKSGQIKDDVEQAEKKKREPVFEDLLRKSARALNETKPKIDESAEKKDDPSLEFFDEDTKRLNEIRKKRNGAQAETGVNIQADSLSLYSSGETGHFHNFKKGDVLQPGTFNGPSFKIVEISEEKIESSESPIDNRPRYSIENEED